MPNIVQPEPVVQEIRPRDPSPAPQVPRAEEPIDNHQDQFFSPVEDEIHSSYRRSQRIASLPRMDYNETNLARAAASRSAGNDQTPTTSKKGSMKKTMKEIRKSLTTALNATLTTPLTPSRSPSPTPRQPLPVRSKPQTERNNSPKPQRYNQSSSRSADQSPSRTPDQNNRYRNTSRYQQRSPSPGRNNSRAQDRPRDNRYSPQNSRSYPRQQSQSPHTWMETGQRISIDNLEEIIHRQGIKAQDNTSQLIDENHIIDHITSTNKTNTDHRHHIDSKIPDANLHIGI
jgi:hypothetical protein